MLDLAARAVSTERADSACAIAAFAAGLGRDGLTGDVAAAAKANIVDTLACAVAGSSAAGVAEVLDLVRTWGGAAQAGTIVFGDVVPAHHAAWVNAVMAHARDYDDTHDEAVLHAGVSAVPAALAAAQLSGNATGKDLLAGVAAGLETTCRLGLATDLGVIESGLMYTSLFGYFGATVAAGRVLGLSEDELVNAIGIAYSQASGNHQVTRDAALTKRMQPGFAAKAALISVQLARKGVRGAQNTFDGVDGLFRVYLGNRADSSRLVSGLGSRFEFLDLSYKPYPCCRFTHAAIDAALQARAEAGPAAAISRVEARVSRQCYEAVCTPIAMRKAPQTVVQAQFSIPYTVAAALVDGNVGLAHFSPEGMRRDDIMSLAGRVDATVDENIESGWSREISPTELTIEMEDGRRVTASATHAKGHARNPMTNSEIATKLSDCFAAGARSMAPEAVARFRHMVGQMESLDDPGKLLEPLTGAGPEKLQ